MRSAHKGFVVLLLTINAAISCSKPHVALEPEPAGSGGQPQPPAADAGKPEPDATVTTENDAGADKPPARPIASPPSYQGNRNGDACNTTLHTTGFEPADDKRHPLFLYFVGTEFVSADESSKYTCKAGAKVTEAMAKRGFVALSVEYDNLVGAILNNKLTCLFSKDRPDSLIETACKLPNVDCGLGIATWGHSQGALLAHAAAIGDSRVKAVWTTGYGGNDNPPLPYDRLRVVNAEGDTMNGAIDTLNKAANFSSAACPDDGRSKCLRADGSGWIRVLKLQNKTNSADHCWFDKKSCSVNAETLEPSWIDPRSTEAYALEANADWVANTVVRP